MKVMYMLLLVAILLAVEDNIVVAGLEIGVALIFGSLSERRVN